MLRVFVRLTDKEMSALRRSAERDCRDPRDQLRYLIVKALTAEQVAQPAPAPSAAPSAEVAHVTD